MRAEAIERRHGRIRLFDLDEFTAVDEPESAYHYDPPAPPYGSPERLSHE